MTGTAGFSVYPVGQQAAAQWVQTKYEIEFKSLRLANFTITLLNMSRFRATQLDQWI